MAKKNFSSMIAFVFLNSAAAALIDPYPLYRKIYLPVGASGSNSISFSQNNLDVAYVSTNDGRVLKLLVNNGTFLKYSYTSPERTDACDGNNDHNKEPICGKVLGLSVDNSNQILYAADKDLGLFSIDIARGGLATFITNTAGDQQFKHLTGVDVDPTCGDVYFVDRDTIESGRLIKYDPKTKEVTVILSGLSLPSAPAVSIDGTFVLIPQVQVNNIVKYYIKGLLKNQSEVIKLPGSPRKIKRASRPGEFWVAVDKKDASSSSITVPSAYKLNSLGWELINKDLSPQYPAGKTVGVIQENTLFSFFVGSPVTDYITQYLL